MPNDTDIFVVRAKEHLSNLSELSKWIETLYFSDNFGNLLKRPVLSMLKTAVTFLHDNLTWLLERYQAGKS